MLSAAAAARPLPPHLAPVLLPPLCTSLRTLHSQGIPLPAPVAGATEGATGGATAAPADSSEDQQLVDALRRCGVLAGPLHGDSSRPVLQQPPENAPAGTAGQLPGCAAGSSQAAGGSRAPAPVCSLLLAGDGEAGQQAAAAALLRLFQDSQLHTLSLPAMLMAGACGLLHHVMHFKYGYLEFRGEPGMAWQLLDRYRLGNGYAGV